MWDFAVWGANWPTSLAAASMFQCGRRIRLYIQDNRLKIYLDESVALCSYDLCNDLQLSVVLCHRFLERQLRGNYGPRQKGINTHPDQVTFAHFKSLWDDESPQNLYHIEIFA
jgi:hypothetical protein